MVWFIRELRIGISELFKDFSSNHHKTCSNFKYLNWFCQLDFCSSFCWIEDKITSILFKIIWIFICQTSINCIPDLLPSNTLLRIRCTDDVFIKRCKSQYIIWIEVNITINEHQMSVWTAKKLINQIVSCTCDKTLIEQIEKPHIHSILTGNGCEVTRGLCIHTSTHASIHRSCHENLFLS